MVIWTNCNIANNTNLIANTTKHNKVVDLEACLMFFKDSNGSIKNSINGKTIRIEMYNPISPNLLPVLKAWSRDLDKNDIDWCRVLNNIFTG